MNVLAILFYLVGVILLMGNITGCWATFPYAGFVFMMIGWLLGKLAKE